MRYVLVDTDCGVDDALALGYVAHTADIVLACVVSTWGNCTATEAASNAKYILDMAGAIDIPVVAGSPPKASWQRGDAHGSDGLGDTEQPRPSWTGPQGAAERIVQFARDHAGEAEVLCIGPLTNLAAALTLEPQLPELLSRVVVMAGHGQNRDDWLNEVGDTNTRHNPRATQTVADSALPVVWVGIDVTRAVLLEDGDFSEGTLGGSLRRIHHAYGVQRGGTYGYNAQVLWKVPAHDGVTAACLVDPLRAGLSTVTGRMTVLDEGQGPVLRRVGTGPHEVAECIAPDSVRAMLRSAT
uniref:nucleoside hydrolase n=1 Tax=Rhodococcus qingshengii TaxID=334542 RepID=UPI001C4DECB9|nr:nucleoside hydrolase [Rhodococcus qingshengii]